MVDWAEERKLDEKYFNETSTVFSKNVDFKHNIKCESIVTALQ
jgi:hypothetical protein